MNDNPVATNPPRIPKKAASVPYLLILVCFLFPFVEVSCQGQRIMSLTGYQLAFGTEIQSPGNAFGGPPSAPKKVGGSPVLVIALVCVLNAAVLCFFRPLLSAALSGVAALMMFVVKAAVDADAVRNGHGLVTVSYGGGFFLTLLLLAGGAVLCFLSRGQRKPVATTGE